jgi:site-specific DNA-cytosine methylase
MNVLSLFDGISCGQVALNRAGIKYDNYYASEIDKHAIQITQYNNPNTVQLGDVKKWGEWDIDFSTIDLILAGFPCQSWSMAGRMGGATDPRGQLMFDMMDIYNHIKTLNPNVRFLFENVRMKKEFQDYVNMVIGVEPIKINSNLLSAQNRERLYWTNIPNITQLENKNIFIEDILDEEFDEKYWLKPRNSELLRNKVDLTNAPNVCCIDVYNKKFKVDRKSPTLTLPHHNSLRLYQNGRIRKLTPEECEKLQTLPVGYTNAGVSDIHRYSSIGNGWTVDVIAHIFGGLK